MRFSPVSWISRKFFQTEDLIWVRWRFRSSTTVKLDKWLSEIFVVNRHVVKLFLEFIFSALRSGNLPLCCYWRVRDVSNWRVPATFCPDRMLQVCCWTNYSQRRSHLGRRMQGQLPTRSPVRLLGCQLCRMWLWILSADVRVVRMHSLWNREDYNVRISNQWGWMQRWMSGLVFAQDPFFYFHQSKSQKSILQTESNCPRRECASRVKWAPIGPAAKTKSVWRVLLELLPKRCHRRGASSVIRQSARLDSFWSRKREWSQWERKYVRLAFQEELSVLPTRNLPKWRARKHLQTLSSGSHNCCSGSHCWVAVLFHEPVCNWRIQLFVARKLHWSAWWERCSELRVPVQTRIPRKRNSLHGCLQWFLFERRNLQEKQHRKRRVSLQRQLQRRPLRTAIPVQVHLVIDCYGHCRRRRHPHYHCYHCVYDLVPFQPSAGHCRKVVDLRGFVTHY